MFLKKEQKKYYNHIKHASDVFFSLFFLLVRFLLYIIWPQEYFFCFSVFCFYCFAASYFVSFFLVLIVECGLKDIKLLEILLLLNKIVMLFICLYQKIWVIEIDILWYKKQKKNTD